jgi:hypothetical protein
MRELPTATTASSKPDRCEHRGAAVFELGALAVLNCRGAALGFEPGRLDGFELPR